MAKVKKGKKKEEGGEKAEDPAITAAQLAAFGKKKVNVSNIPGPVKAAIVMVALGTDASARFSSCLTTPTSSGSRSR